MTDDLVHRLRDPGTTCCEADIRHEAADMIEELERGYSLVDEAIGMHKRNGWLLGRVHELEAALQQIAAYEPSWDYADGVPLAKIAVSALKGNTS